MTTINFMVRTTPKTAKSVYDLIQSTGLQGYVKTTRARLTELFGEPFNHSGHDKITTEWAITLSGNIVAIYDYKRNELGAPAMNEEYEWHIGGYDNQTAIIQHIVDGNFGTEIIS